MKKLILSPNLFVNIILLYACNTLIYKQVKRFMSKILYFLIYSMLQIVAAPVWALPEPALPSEINSIDLLTNNSIKISTQFTDKKALIFIFMSSKCPCSNSHVSEVKSLQKKYSDFTFFIVHSNVNEEIEFSKKYFASLELPITVLQDSEAKLADTLKAYKTPHSFVVSPKGEILYKGGVTNSNTAEKADKHYLAEALEDIQNIRPVKITEAKALGCFISREKD